MVIATEMLAIILDTFQYDLNKALHNQIELLEGIKVGFLSLQYSIDYYHEDEAAILNYSPFALWKKNDIYTWIYNKDGSIYLEISPFYSNLYAPITKERNSGAFEQFVQHYKPILIEKIDYRNAKQSMKDILNISNLL